MIRGWPRLSQWIAEDREGLRLQHRLSEDANEWLRRQRDSSFLYHGARLAQLLEWRKANEAVLNPLERDFLDSSAWREKREEEGQKERQRRELEAARRLADAEKQRAETAETLAITERKAKKRLRNFVWGLALLFFVAIGIAQFAWRQRTIALEEESNSRQLLYVANINLAQRALDKRTERQHANCSAFSCLKLPVVSSKMCAVSLGIISGTFAIERRPSGLQRALFPRLSPPMAKSSPPEDGVTWGHWRMLTTRPSYGS